ISALDRAATALLRLVTVPVHLVTVYMFPLHPETQSVEQPLRPVMLSRSTTLASISPAPVIVTKSMETISVPMPLATILALLMVLTVAQIAQVYISTAKILPVHLIKLVTTWSLDREMLSQDSIEASCLAIIPLKMWKATSLARLPTVRQLLAI